MTAPDLDPDDRAAWAVFADQLSEAGDVRGELLELDNGRVREGLSAEDDRAMRELIDERVEAWMAHHVHTLPEAEADAFDGYQALVEDFESVAALAPAELRTAMALSSVQLLACMQPDGDRAQGQLQRVLDALIAWVEAAFAEVPPPDAEHLSLAQAEALDSYEHAERASDDSVGPWTALTDAYLLANQWALAYLDAQGVPYYFPAIMCFDLRHQLEGHPEDGWLTESFGYTLELSLRDLTPGGRCHLLTSEQRGAIAGYCWATGNPAMLRWVGAAAPGSDSDGPQRYAQR